LGLPDAQKNYFNLSLQICGFAKKIFAPSTFAEARGLKLNARHGRTTEPEKNSITFSKRNCNTENVALFVYTVS
jgi:hypothetical protein